MSLSQTDRLMVTFGTCTCSYSENKTAVLTETMLQFVYLGVVVKTQGYTKLGAIAVDLLLNIHFSRLIRFNPNPWRLVHE